MAMDHDRVAPANDRWNTAYFSSQDDQEDSEDEFSIVCCAPARRKTSEKAKEDRRWKNLDTILENQLYLGNLTAARSSRTLKEWRFTHILSVCTDALSADLPQSGIQHMRIPVEDVDYADILIHLPSACQFIDEALRSGGVVLVHGVQGISRSAAVVAAYLMWSRRIGAAPAWQDVRKARHQIWPNAGFQEQLVLFELCQYAPSPSNEIYKSWRRKLDRQLQAAGIRR
ncbi:protein-tyrosine phosphatase-like protein [Roridomyces roridus]|uniref:Protein-tyrosine phosphatase-like protein n=1 Tax=Roridomyces roridus TaxID=1738132 RepID=A0AAD7G0J3_9AGAR|nr:protein-tyrosine phosphatase-like protein [Roridomyces roridus]